MRKIRLFGRPSEPGKPIGGPDIQVYDFETGEPLDTAYQIRMVLGVDDSSIRAEITFIEWPNSRSLGRTNFELVEIAEIDIKP